MKFVIDNIGSRSNRPHTLRLNRENGNRKTGAFQPELPGNFADEPVKLSGSPVSVEILLHVYFIVWLESCHQKCIRKVGQSHKKINQRSKTILTRFSIILTSPKNNDYELII